MSGVSIKLLRGTTAFAGLAFLAAQASGAEAASTVITTAGNGNQSLAAGDDLTVTGPTGSITGTGIGVDVINAAALFIDNSGLISAATTGVLLQTTADLTGGIDNSGTIFGTMRGIGAYAGSDISGGIVNQAAGTISAGTTMGIGILASNADISGGIDNSGLISGAFGIVSQSNADILGGITNSGTISAGTAIGIYAGSDISGGIVNTGTIGGGRGIDISSSDMTGAITNQAAGTISGSIGIYVRATSDISGGLDNAGLITGGGQGIDIDGSNVTGSIVNQLGGTILGGSTAILAQGTGHISGGIDNSGMIAGGSYGIMVRSLSDIFGGIDNSGTISGGNAGLALWTTADIFGGVDNTGTISGDVGIDIDGSNVTGSIVNQLGGTISGGTTGISVGGGSTLAGNIENFGTIFGGAYALNVDGASDVSISVINQAGGVISGNTAIYVSGASITGGIFNTGVIEGTGGTAISLNGLTALTPVVLLDGSRVIGDVIDDTPGGGFSYVDIDGDFTTEGNFNVSDLVVEPTRTLTISAGDVITLDDMSASTGTFSFAVDSDVSFGSLVVNNGDVDLTGATVTVTVADIPVLMNGDEMLIADGNAAITGGPGATALAVADDSFIWDFNIVDGTGSVTAGDNTQLYLQAVSLVLANAATPNNAAVGEVLNSLAGTADPELQVIITALNDATDTESMNAVLEGAQPTIDGGFVGVAMGVSDGALDIVDEQMASLRLDGAGSGVAAGNRGSGLYAWGQAFGRMAHQDERSGIDGYDLKTGGAALGVDSRSASEDVIVGLAASFARSSVDSSNINKTETSIDSYQATLYGNVDVTDNFYINGMAAYAYSRNETERYEVLPGISALGEFDSHQFAARLDTGYGFRLGGDTILTPSLMANYAHYDAQDYTETGAGGAGLHVDTDTVSLLEVGGGIDVSWYRKQRDGAIMRPALHLGYRYDLMGEELEMTSNFIGGGGSFMTRGPDPARDKVEAGVGIKYFSTDNWEYSFSYNFQYKTAYTGHEAYLRSGFRF